MVVFFVAWVCFVLLRVVHVCDDGLRKWHRWSLIGHVVIPALLDLGGCCIKGEEGEEVVGDMILISSQQPRMNIILKTSIHGSQHG